MARIIARVAYDGSVGFGRRYPKDYGNLVREGSVSLCVLEPSVRGSSAERSDVSVAVDGMVFGFTPSEAAAIVLERYLASGYEGLRALDGEFALALFDGREQRLFLVRDTFGTRPLYVWTGKTGVVVGSRLRDTLAEAGEPPLLKAEELAKWFTRKAATYCASATPFSGVDRVRPNHIETLEVGERRWSVVRSWDYPTRVDRQRTADDVGRDLPVLLSQSIKKRGIGKAAIFLSGGMDSAAIAAIACGGMLGPRVVEDLTALTAVDSGADHTDGPRAKEVASHLGLEWQSIDLAAYSPTPSFEHLVDLCELPDGIPGLLLPECCEFASRDGVSDVILGLGADEFWDWPRPLTYIPEWIWRARERSGTMIRSARGMKTAIVRGRRPKAGVGRAPTATTGVGNRAERCPSCAASFQAIGCRLWRESVASLESTLGGAFFENLSAVTDAYGLRATHPFLDRQMVTYALSTPPNLVNVGRQRKGLLRRCFGPHLPPGFSEGWTRAHWGSSVEAPLRKVLGFLGLSAEAATSLGLHPLSGVGGTMIPAFELCTGVAWLRSRGPR